MTNLFLNCVCFEPPFRGSLGFLVYVLLSFPQIFLLYLLYKYHEPLNVQVSIKHCSLTLIARRATQSDNEQNHPTPHVLNYF